MRRRNLPPRRHETPRCVTSSSRPASSAATTASTPTADARPATATATATARTAPSSSSPRSPNGTSSVRPLPHSSTSPTESGTLDQAGPPIGGSRRVRRMTMTWSSSDRRAQLPSNWQRVIRPRILRRDGHRCTWIDQGQRCTERATEVDHRRRGDDHRDSNLRSLCGPHHATKSSAEGHAARRARPSRRRRPPEAHPGIL